MIILIVVAVITLCAVFIGALGITLMLTETASEDIATLLDEHETTNDKQRNHTQNP